VVLAYMPGMGKGAAAGVAAGFRSSFARIRLGLVVGICGGVSHGATHGGEILLGDVVVSTGVVQFDFGRQFSDRAIRKDTLQDNLGRPNPEIRSFLNKM
jgi:nucleoside phosphorylase